MSSETIEIWVHCANCRVEISQSSARKIRGLYFCDPSCLEEWERDAEIEAKIDARRGG